MIGKSDFVMAFVMRWPDRPMSQPSWTDGEPSVRDEARVEWVLTGPWPACSRCGKELKVHIVERPCLGLLWSACDAHNAPCGQRCLPGLDSWIGDCGPPHISTDTCRVCMKAAREQR